MAWLEESPIYIAALEVVLIDSLTSLNHLLWQGELDTLSILHDAEMAQSRLRWMVRREPSTLARRYGY